MLQEAQLFHNIRAKRLLFNKNADSFDYFTVAPSVLALGFEDGNRYESVRVCGEGVGGETIKILENYRHFSNP